MKGRFTGAYRDPPGLVAAGGNQSESAPLVRGNPFDAARAAA